MKVAGFQRKLTLKNIKRNIIAADYFIHSGKRAKRLLMTLSQTL